MVKVHVNGHIIKHNQLHGTNDPPLTIRRGRVIERAHEVELVGPSKVVYKPLNPLSCGARVWIEAENAIGVINAS